MTSFNNQDLDSIATVNLANDYRKPDARTQFIEHESPGVTGSHLLLGGKRPQTFTLTMRLRGTGASTAEAQLALTTNDNTIGDLLRTTGEFVDPNGVTFGGCTLLDRIVLSTTNYHNEGATYVATMDIALVFKRTLSD